MPDMMPAPCSQKSAPPSPHPPRCQHRCRRHALAGRGQPSGWITSACLGVVARPLRPGRHLAGPQGPAAGLPLAGCSESATCTPTAGSACWCMYHQGRGARLERPGPGNWLAGVEILLCLLLVTTVMRHACAWQRRPGVCPTCHGVHADHRPVSTPLRAGIVYAAHADARRPATD